MVTKDSGDTGWWYQRHDRLGGGASKIVSVLICEHSNDIVSVLISEYLRNYSVCGSVNL